MTNKIAYIVDGFRHGANIFGCNMNEYRHIMTKKLTFAQSWVQVGFLSDQVKSQVNASL